MNRLLGENTGHLFIKEIRNTLSNEDLTCKKNMGRDLSMMQVEREIIKVERDRAEREQKK